MRKLLFLATVMIGILFNVSLGQAERKVLSCVPYINQVEDMDKAQFSGYNACGPTSAVILLQYYHLQPDTSELLYPGWFVWNGYDNGFSDRYGNRYNEILAEDWVGRKVVGAHGFIISKDKETGYWMTFSNYLEQYLKNHGLYLKPKVYQNRFQTIKENIDKGLPLLGHSIIDGNGHFLVIIGYDSGNSGNEEKVVVHDPYGNANVDWYDTGADNGDSGKEKTYPLDGYGSPSGVRIKIDYIYEAYPVGLYNEFPAWVKTDNDKPPSQWIADAYAPFANVLGKPIDNGGGIFVHRLSRDPWLGDLWAQDFEGGMIVVNKTQQKAYVLRGAFCWIYRGGSWINPGDSEPIELWGPNDLGAPLSNEIFEYFTNEFGQQVVIRQYFENGRLTYLVNSQSTNVGIINVEYSLPTDPFEVPLFGDSVKPVPATSDDGYNYVSGGDVPVDLSGLGMGGREDGNSSNSNSENGDNNANPDTANFSSLSNFTAYALGANRIQVEWDLVDGAVDYEVRIFNHLTGDFLYSLRDNDGLLMFDNLEPNTPYEIDAKVIYLDRESNWTDKIVVFTFAPNRPNLSSATLLTCGDVQDNACINPQTLFPYSLSIDDIFLYLKLAEAHPDSLYFRFDLYDPSGNFVESFDRYGNYSMNQDSEWVTYAKITSAVQSVVQRIGQWSVKIYYGFDISSINNFYTTYYFEVDEPEAISLDIPQENPPTTNGTHEYTFASYGDTVIFINYNTATGDTRWKDSEKLDVATRKGISRIHRSLVKFNISGIPSQATIISAHLELYATFETEYVDNTFYVNRITEDWLADYATWTQRTLTDAWSSAGAAWTTQGQAQTIIPSLYSDYGNGDYNQWISWDVTKIVQDWVNGSPNYGLIIRQKDISNRAYNQAIIFCSSDNPNIDCRPKLRVVYEIKE